MILRTYFVARSSNLSILSPFSSSRYFSSPIHLPPTTVSFSDKLANPLCFLETPFIPPLQPLPFVFSSDHRSTFSSAPPIPFVFLPIFTILCSATPFRFVHHTFFLVSLPPSLRHLSYFNITPASTIPWYILFPLFPLFLSALLPSFLFVTVPHHHQAILRQVPITIKLFSVKFPSPPSPSPSSRRQVRPLPVKSPSPICRKYAPSPPPS